MYSQEIVPGSRKNPEIQCRMDAGGAPRYSAADALSGSVWAAGATSASFAVAVAWLLVNAETGAAQTGYDEGQVVATLTAAQTATLKPGAVYYLRIFRAIAGAAGDPEEIATYVLRVRNPSSAT